MKTRNASVLALVLWANPREFCVNIVRVRSKLVDENYHGDDYHGRKVSTWKSNRPTQLEILFILDGMFLIFFYYCLMMSWGLKVLFVWALAYWHFESNSLPGFKYCLYLSFHSLILPPSPSLTNLLRPLDGTLLITSRGKNNLTAKQLCINFSRVA